MNTNTVTSMVWRTWLQTLPNVFSAVGSPQKLSAKVFASRFISRKITNTSNGTILAIVTILLMPAAPCTPRRIRKWKAQTSTEATRTAMIVLPSPKTGKNAPSVDLISTQYETLPTQVPIQKPMAAANPQYSPKPYLA